MNPTRDLASFVLPAVEPQEAIRRPFPGTSARPDKETLERFRAWVAAYDANRTA